MAYYATANLATAQAKLIGAFQAGELRFTMPKVFQKYLQNSNILFPDYNVLKTRDDRAIEANYFTRSSRSLGSARAHNHTGTPGASTTLTPSWTTYADDFMISLKQADKSVFTWDDMYMNELNNVIANMAEGLETAATAHLFANRSGVNSAAIQGTFNSTQDAFEIEDQYEDTAVQITKMVMDINKFGGSYTVFCDSVAYNKFGKFAAQGVSNSTNLSFQFAGVEFVHAVGLYALNSALTTPYIKGFWIAVPDGMIGALPWIPKQNRIGVETPVSKYSSIINPVDGLPYAVHEYMTAADGSGTGGYTQDVKNEIELSIDVALSYAPLSSGTPLMAFAIVDTVVA